MKKLLSLPPNLVNVNVNVNVNVDGNVNVNVNVNVDGNVNVNGNVNGNGNVFYDITGLSPREYFCTCDPEGRRIGSGGGTAWLLWQAFLHCAECKLFSQWLKQEKRILLHAGGQSRRLPAYAPSGKILTPIPVFRWERGQRLSQDLLSLQLPLYEHIMQAAPEGLNTMVVSGDVLIRTSEPLPPVPQADVVCYGLWLDAQVACHHGVFVADRHSPQVLKQMLQKPGVEQLKALQQQHFYLTDIGVWLLSDRAVELLMKRCGPYPTPAYEEREAAGGDAFKFYDLYSDFGRALGTHPEVDDAELAQLSVAIVPLPGGEFYHFGTSQEMISSMVRLQEAVSDQRLIMHNDRKPQQSIFVQNAVTAIAFTEENSNIWIENSCIGPRWTLTHDNIVTGVPQNDWQVHLAPGQCIDMVPMGADDLYAVRCYYIDDRFDGAEQQRQQFPVVRPDEAEPWIVAWANGTYEANRADGHLLSAEQISSRGNLHRLFAQREAFRQQNWTALAANWRYSVFYQLDLDDAAQAFHQGHIPLPPPLPADAPLMTRIHDAMFRGDNGLAFGLLQQGIVQQLLTARQEPHLSVAHDQIVWARSPVRIDIAGGWTDTPPSCLLEGGSVVNLAIELNGQPPIQAYVKPSTDYSITLRSIDLGAVEVVHTFDELLQYNKVGSPFSIPKAALALAGFAPQFAGGMGSHASLSEQLHDFGCGIELTLLSAIPAGSGLGTSSVLAATVLAALSDFCSLAWDKNEIGRRTLALEQLLTTGGGWQDQFGGILPGVKLLQTSPGFAQQPLARWLPTDIYTQPEYRQCHLLYYTGITRTAKQILAEIVRRMFLNSHEQLQLLREMKAHAVDMYEAIQRLDYQLMGRLVRRTWQQNQQLDSGTNPEAVRRLTNLVDDLCLGYKLPGAGGGGYLYMVAKDPEAAARIRQILNGHRQHANARFVDMALSTTGLQISRS